MTERIQERVSEPSAEVPVTPYTIMRAHGVIVGLMVDVQGIVLSHDLIDAYMKQRYTDQDMKNKKMFLCQWHDGDAELNFQVVGAENTDADMKVAAEYIRSCTLVRALAEAEARSTK